MNSSSDKSPEPFEEPANLRFLRRLVTVLTATMIIGVITIVGLLVMRLNTPIAADRATEFSATEIAVPAGAVVTAVTRTENEVLVVTEDRRLLMFDRSGQTLLREIPLD
ncbi:DUF6476 family protein [Shimia ponticola]|uniref:DUF6476 family protein n=1 Tax=Shimia ponticola TaxID=2582893 RepID=UPI0011BD627A|nr:DUF6476 family protein [Shimia ponticola]